MGSHASQSVGEPREMIAIPTVSATVATLGYQRDKALGKLVALPTSNFQLQTSPCPPPLRQTNFHAAMCSVSFGNVTRSPTTLVPIC